MYFLDRTALLRQKGYKEGIIDTIWESICIVSKGAIFATVKGVKNDDQSFADILGFWERDLYLKFLSENENEFGDEVEWKLHESTFPLDTRAVKCKQF